MAKATEATNAQGSGKANIVVGGIIAVVLAAAVAAFAWMQLGAQSAVLHAIVHDGDGGTRELSLSEDSETVVATSLGTNTVVVEDGQVYVREADCDNQDCVHQGKIGDPSRQIICLPHKLWIEVVAAGEEGGQMDVAAAGSENAAGEFDTIGR